MTDLLEEISQQPAALSGLRKFYASPGAIPAKGLRSLAPHWPPTVVFTGMGSSLFAAYPAQAYLTEQGVRALVWETAELVHHHLKVLRPDTLLVVVSQSGQTAEVLRLLESLPAKARVLAVTNVEASPLAKRANLLLPLMAGGQVAVSTKTYTCSVAVLMYLAFAIAGKAPSPLTQEVMRAVEAQETDPGAPRGPDATHRGVFQSAPLRGADVTRGGPRNRLPGSADAEGSGAAGGRTHQRGTIPPRTDGNHQPESSLHPFCPPGKNRETAPETRRATSGNRAGGCCSSPICPLTTP